LLPVRSAGKWKCFPCGSASRFILVSRYRENIRSRSTTARLPCLICEATYWPSPVITSSKATLLVNSSVNIGSAIPLNRSLSESLGGLSGGPVFVIRHSPADVITYEFAGVIFRMHESTESLYPPLDYEGTPLTRSRLNARAFERAVQASRCAAAF